MNRFIIIKNSIDMYIIYIMYIMYIILIDIFIYIIIFDYFSSFIEPKLVSLLNPYGLKLDKIPESERLYV